VQFVGTREKLPMVAACTAVSTTDLAPYFQTGQLLGLVGGMAGAAGYENGWSASPGPAPPAPTSSTSPTMVVIAGDRLRQRRVLRRARPPAPGRPLVTALPWIDVVGYWLGIFLTFSVLSFLYKDNPFYKLVEHLFIGVSVGYLIVLQYGDNIEPKVDRRDLRRWPRRRLARRCGSSRLVLVVMMFAKVLQPRWAWLGRYPLAFVVAFYAGLQVNADGPGRAGRADQVRRRLDRRAQGRPQRRAEPEALTALPGSSPAIATKWIAERAQRPFASLDDAITRASLSPLERGDLAAARGSLVGLDAKAAVSPGHHDGFGIVSNLLLLAGLLASLVYFYFSVAHRGPIGGISRFGVWTLMIGFGASFGLTVQGRISLAIGRAYDVLGRTLAPEDAARVHAPAGCPWCRSGSSPPA
jgi:hypothetical protein